jgi:hypothetical protein
MLGRHHACCGVVALGLTILEPFLQRADEVIE